MRLLENAETLDRLAAQGEILCKALYKENELDPTGPRAEFLRGNLAGWCSTLHTLYQGRAEEIVEHVRVKTNFPIPLGISGCCQWISLENGCPAQGACRWRYFPTAT
jgi:hypothetical protein